MVRNRKFSLRKLFQLGGSGSGNFNHKGRPGEVGGSSEGKGKLNVAAGFEDVEYRNKLKQAATYVSGLKKDITIRKDFSKGTRYGTVGTRENYEIYIDPEMTKGKSVGFIASVLKHESIHLE